MKKRTSIMTGLFATALGFGFITPVLATNAPLERNMMRVTAGTKSSPIESVSDSQDPSLSADGRYVAFESETDGWTPYDGDDETDHIYVFDTQTHTIEIIDVGESGGSPVEADGTATDPDISADGRYVVFESWATNLPGAETTNGEENIIFYDRQTKTYELISAGGTLASPLEFDDSSTSPEISADGRFVVFESDSDDGDPSDTNGYSDIYMKDRQTNTMSLISSGSDEDNDHPAISSNGRYITYSSESDSIVAGDTNSEEDVFVYDRVNGTTEIVSIGGTQASPIQSDGNSDDSQISADGRYVTFESNATNFVAGDTNSSDDIYRFDRETHTIELVSVGGTSESPIYSDSSSYTPSISGDGRFIIFLAYTNTFPTSPVANTNENDQAFVKDMETGTLQHVSDPLVANGFTGTELENDADDTVISSDGSVVGFTSYDNYLVANDTNGSNDDVFIAANRLFSVTVDDTDGVDDTIEAAAPNGGDANNDGTPDAQQSNVTSLRSSINNAYVVLEAGGVCTANEAVAVNAESSVETEDDDTYDYPAGLLEFTMNGCTTGGTETITQYYYGDFAIEDVVVRKHDTANNTYTTIEAANLSLVAIGGEAALRVQYDVTDGGDLDADGVANGVIVDPVGIAELAINSPDTGFERVNNQLMIALFGIGVSLAIIGIYGYRKQNR